MNLETAAGESLSIQLPLDMSGKACDSHIHVYGSKDKYPVRSEARYGWYESPVSAHQPFALRSGLGRAVVVQPSIYGNDNSCTLDAAKSLGQGGRAVVEIDEASVGDTELDEMHAQGARGVRLTVALAGGPDEDLYKRTVANIDATARRIARNPWHMEVMVPGWLAVRLLPVLNATGLPWCLGHVAGLRPDAASTPSDLEAIIEEIAGGTRGYVKLSAFYRLTADRTLNDLVPIVRRLIAAAPNRMLWGTDFPHPKYADQVTPDEQLRMLLRCVPDARVLEQILAANPGTFYDFQE